jgi:hypothetical protein
MNSGTEIEVKTWKEFDAKAKELVASGHTNVTPNDNPIRMKIAYMFTNPNDVSDRFWLKIRIDDLKISWTDQIKQAMQSEVGKINIAKTWGNYKPLEFDPNVKKLTFEETEKLIQQYNSKENKC